MQFGTGSQGEGNVFIGKSGAQAAGFISENFAELDSLKGTPREIANGFATGVAMSFTPFVGFHLLLSLAVARLSGQNGIAAALGTIAGNPWTFPLIWYITLHIGLFVLGADAPQLPVDFKALFTELFHTVIGLDFSAFLEDIWPVFYPMLIGSIPLYIVVWWSVSRMAWRVLLNNPAKNERDKDDTGAGM